jgi:phytoene/squalene synthetase
MSSIRSAMIGLLLLVAACGLDADAVALAEGACRTLEDVQDEPFDPDQLAAYNEWMEANESEMNSVAVGGGSADYEAALREECGPVVEPFAVAFEDQTGTSFWQTSAGP